MCVGVTGDEKVDEMETETPEHLSELENGDGQQDAADKPDDNTSKLSSPQLVSPDRPSSSGAKDRHRRERRSSSRHSDKKPAEDEAASGSVATDLWGACGILRVYRCHVAAESHSMVYLAVQCICLIVLLTRSRSVMVNKFCWQLGLVFTRFLQNQVSLPSVCGTRVLNRLDVLSRWGR